MTIKHTWAFPSLEVTYSANELQNVVTTVHWTLIATDDQYSASSYGASGVGTPTPEAFISYDDLTEEEVISWVTTALGGEEAVQQMKDNLVAQIETKKAPKSGSMTPPWIPASWYDIPPPAAAVE